MKKIKLLYIISTFVVVLMSFSCTKDKPLQNEVAWKKVCTDWGKSPDEIKDLMGKYKLKASNNTTLMYTGSKRYTCVSYRFDSDKLCSVLVVVPADRYSLKSILSSFESVISLGERLGAHLFLDQNNNIVISISSKTKNDVDYYVVGYSEYLHNE